MFTKARQLHPSSPHSGWVGRLRRTVWLLPLMAAAVFVAGVLVWAYRADADEQSERRNTMIADALSTEAQLRSRLDEEMAHMETLGRQLHATRRDAAGLAANAEVIAGLRRFWLSVTWLDANNRIVAHVPLRGAEIDGAGKDSAGPSGVSSHMQLLVAGEKLVVRYSPALLLRKGIPWWLTRKYDVQLVDASDQIIASLDEVPLRLDAKGRESYMVLVGGNMPGAYLELISRELHVPFWRTLPIVLVVGFLSLMIVATVLLRRQMGQISLAEGAWRTEAAWREAMEDSALVGLRARDAQGRILYVNRTFCEMVGLPAEELVGLTPPMPYWPPDAIDEVMIRNRRNLAGNAPREGYEALWRHRDGHTLNVMVFESPLIDADGSQMGWMGSIIDISARKRLEERERHQAEVMAQQSRLTTLGEVASALAHQLNQPLTAIMGYNAGLQRMMGDAGYDPQAVMQALRMQGEQAGEAGRIVGRIREFLTRRSPQRESASLEDMAHRVVDLLQRDLKTAGVQIVWAMDEVLPAVYADPILMEQVLINLIRNAIDALKGQPSGRIRLAASAAGERFVRMDVEDDGPGLQGRTVDQLCAAFFSTKADGMGMGLAICRSVIEVHHGGMDAGVSLWGGARFSFTLPVFDATMTADSWGIDEDRAAMELLP